MEPPGLTSMRGKGLLMPGLQLIKDLETRLLALSFAQLRTQKQLTHKGLEMTRSHPDPLPVSLHLPSEKQMERHPRPPLHHLRRRRSPSRLSHAGSILGARDFLSTQIWGPKMGSPWLRGDQASPPAVLNKVTPEQCD